jgi:membrane protein implicated in regulation of membrane protease activity
MMFFIAAFTEWPVVESLIAIAIILILLDVFIPTEILSHIAIVLLCVAVFWLLEIPILWRIAASIFAWFVMVGGYYLFWKQVVTQVGNKFIAPTRFKTSVESIVGSSGVVEEIEGSVMCRVQDELWPIEDCKFCVGTAVSVVSIEEGKLILEAK